MKLALAHLVYAFDFELTDDRTNKNWLEQLTFALWDKKPLMVKMKCASEE